ncbi:MAG: purine-nucleoside phosphorylase [Candidatus Riflebacteria bacterium]|nr:purine-nucleoside phosphorylase [Candidatus Riflebacteria bacterium]
MTTDIKKRVEEALSAIRNKVTQTPSVAIVLGSGLGSFADTITEAVAIPYGDIPHFPASTVKGHKGRLIVGKTAGKTVVAMQGRFHFYEGYPISDVTFPIRVMIALGARDLIITNASGALNRSYAVGDLMIMTDHINSMGINPLIGPNDDTIGPRFPPMQGVYTPALVQSALELGRKIGAPVQRGVYVAVTGPSYETAAELRALRAIGADAVGMSTVPEVIVAVHSGIKRVFGVSCITDMATGDHHEDVNHEDVIKAAAAAQPYFLALLQGMIERF